MKQTLSHRNFIDVRIAEIVDNVFLFVEFRFAGALAKVREFFFVALTERFDFFFGKFHFNILLLYSLITGKIMQLDYPYDNQKSS